VQRSRLLLALLFLHLNLLIYHALRHRRYLFPPLRLDRQADGATLNLSAGELWLQVEIGRGGLCHG